MKYAVLVLLFSLGLSATARAAEPTGTRCRVLVPSDPAEKPNNFDKSIVDLQLAPDGIAHYLLLSQDLGSAEEISKDAYFAHKKAGFKEIGSRYVVLVQRSEDGLTTVFYGQADTKAVKLGGGTTVWAEKSERLTVAPDGNKFGVVCGPITK